MQPEQRATRSKLANAVAVAKKSNAPDDARRVEELRRDFRAGRLAEHIEAVVAAAPPLTAERDRLALLVLRGDAA